MISNYWEGRSKIEGIFYKDILHVYLDNGTEYIYNNGTEMSLFSLKSPLCQWCKVGKSWMLLLSYFLASLKEKYRLCSDCTIAQISLCPQPFWEHSVNCKQPQILPFLAQTEACE